MAAAVMLTLSALPARVSGAHPVTSSPRSLRQEAGLHVIEQRIADALAAEDLAHGVIAVHADTNGHLTIAGLVFIIPPSPAAGGLPVSRYAWRLARTALTAVPILDEVHLTGYRSTDTIDPRNVAFTAAVSRAELANAPGATSRVWSDTRPGETPAWAPPPRARKERGPRVIGEFPTGTPPDWLLYRGDPSRPTLALTFDDGPGPIYTTLLLDTLDRLGVKATFFLVGERVVQYPYFAQAIAQRRHDVGNHSFHHPNLARLTDAEVQAELLMAQEAIARVTGITPRYFRPPGGDYNASIVRIARSFGLTTVFWTDDPGDYAHLTPRLLELRLLSRTSNGGILLLHQGVGDTVRILPAVAELLRREGYYLTKVSDLPLSTGGP
jgi:peptidoglycan/xylan/chitin deacetylase (PgdA/CDA1 family)